MLDKYNQQNKYLESARNLGFLLLIVTYNNKNLYEVVIHLAVMINGPRVFIRFFLFPSASFIITAKYEYILVSVCLFLVLRLQSS